MNLDARGRPADIAPSSLAGSGSSDDDPRVASGLDEYLAELQAGKRPSREEFLGRHPEIAEALGRGLDVLEFLHSAAGTPGPRPTPPPDGEDLPPETILGDYRLVREVGRGGMGVVYEARQISLGRRVAVKVLSGAGVLDQRRLQRFRIEAQAVAQLSHPHIVPIYAVGADRGIHYYAMQYVEGRTLADVFEDHRGQTPGGTMSSTLPPGDGTRDRLSWVVAESSGAGGDPEESGHGGDRPPATASDGPTSSPGKDRFRAIAQLGIQAAEALDHAHAMGILHRDIKPSNLLIDPRGGLWIADFGLARFRDDAGLTHTGDLVGTLRYMAPEMVTGRRASFDPRSDIYALGATFYELLTLRHVFDGHDRRHLLNQIAHDEPASPRRVDRAIPRDLETIVMKAMDKEAESRYATASEMADDLRRYLDDQPIRARPPSPWDHARKWARRHRAVLVAAAGGAMVALGIGLGLVWQERRRTAEVSRERERVVGRLGEGAEILDKGMGLLHGGPGLLELSDILTMKGMEQFARTTSSAVPNPARQQFHQMALDFYERLAGERSIDDRMRALALRRLGFTRMVSRQDPAAEGDFRRAIAIYESLLAREPRDPGLRDGLADSYYNLGILQYAHGRMARAEPSFRRAIAITEERATESPADPQLLDSLAGSSVVVITWKSWDGMNEQVERDRRALLDTFARLTKALNSDAAIPDRRRRAAEAYRSLARKMADSGWTRDREEALRCGLAFEPNDPGLLLDLAELLAFRREADPSTLAQAVEVAKKAVAAGPESPDSLRVLALAHLRARDVGSANRAIERSLKLRPPEGRASDQLVMAMIARQRGSRDQARSWYVRAVDRMARAPQDDPDAQKYWSEAKVELKPLLVAEHLADETDR